MRIRGAARRARRIIPRRAHAADGRVLDPRVLADWNVFQLAILVPCLLVVFYEHRQYVTDQAEWANVRRPGPPRAHAHACARAAQRAAARRGRATAAAA